MDKVIRVKIFIGLLGISALFMGCSTYEAGVYSGASSHGIEKVHLKEGNRFDYRYSSCERGANAEGHYELKDDSLVLFVESPGKSTSEGIFIDSSRTEGDSVEVDVEIINSANKEPFPFMDVMLRDTTGDPIIGKVTDTAGRATLKHEKQDAPIELRVVGIGFPEKVVKVVPDRSYHISIRSKLTGRGGITYEDGDRIVLPIVGIRNEHMLLAGENSDAVLNWVGH